MAFVAVSRLGALVYDAATCEKRYIIIALDDPDRVFVNATADIFTVMGRRMRKLRLEDAKMKAYSLVDGSLRVVFFWLNDPVEHGVRGGYIYGR
jgi:hypothetical protein